VQVTIDHAAAAVYDHNQFGSPPVNRVRAVVRDSNKQVAVAQPVEKDVRYGEIG